MTGNSEGWVRIFDEDPGNFNVYPEDGADVITKTYCFKKKAVIYNKCIFKKIPGGRCWHGKEGSVIVRSGNEYPTLPHGWKYDR